MMALASIFVGLNADPQSRGDSGMV